MGDWPGSSVLVVALVISAPGSSATHLDPASAAPGGTKGLVELVRASGGRATVSATAPDASTAVALLLVDTTSETMTAELDQWVRRGGVLVVADPRSSFVPPARAAPSLFGLAAATVPRGECTIAALGGVDQVAPGDGSARFEVPDGAQACIDQGSGAFVVDQPVGDGHVVSVGGADAFTNQLLGTDDNAVLAVGLLAPRPGTELQRAVGHDRRAGPGQSLTSLISTGVRFGLWELVAAFVLYALWRGRRLGRPVAEVQPVQIGGSELVSAHGTCCSSPTTPTGPPGCCGPTCAASSASGWAWAPAPPPTCWPR